MLRGGTGTFRVNNNPYFVYLLAQNEPPRRAALKFDKQVNKITGFVYPDGESYRPGFYAQRAKPASEGSSPEGAVLTQPHPFPSGERAGG